MCNVGELWMRTGPHVGVFLLLSWKIEPRLWKMQQPLEVRQWSMLCIDDSGHSWVGHDYADAWVEKDDFFIVVPGSP